MRIKIVLLGIIIAGLGFSAGYFLKLPYTSYAVAVGVILLFAAIFMRPKPRIA